MYKDGYWAWGGSRSTIPVARPQVHRKLIKGERRDVIIRRAMDILRDWNSSIFEREASCRHGLRQGFVLAGHRWILAEMEAEAIVNTALDRLGAKRPTWEMGQPEYVENDGACINCGRELDLGKEGLVHQFFCDEVCREAKRQKRESTYRYWTTATVKHARYVALKATYPPQTCESCAKEYQPTKPDQRWCSNECFQSAREDRLPERNCQHCGRLFHPTTRSKAGIYCSPVCSSAGRTVVALKDCEVCGTPFKHYRQTQRCCSIECSRIEARAAMTERPCQQCGETFTPASSKSLYCGPRCRNRANYEKAKRSACQCAEM